MKKLDKNNRSNIWKFVLLTLEVIAIILLVLILFFQTWIERPEKFKNPTVISNICTKELSETICVGYLTVPEAKEERKEPEPPTFEEIVASYVFDICQSYPAVDPNIVLSVIYHESRFTPNVSSGKCVGLMQVSTYWHQDRAARLGVEDFWDPYGNILVGVDLLNELIQKNDGDILRALTSYNGGTGINGYARSVIRLSEQYKGGLFYEIL